MNEALLAFEPYIRLSAFAGVFATLAIAEAWLPRRKLALSRWLRWPSNLAITVLNTVLVRVLFPTAAVGAALFAEARGVGLINWLDLSELAAVPLAVLVLDLAIYLQHVMFHAVPALWRLHRMHHADLDIDVTTGARFHPVEIVLSMIIKLMVVFAIGAPAAAVILFEVLLNATSMFNHANLGLSRGLDAVLRRVLVTPDMHRVHHSVEPRETNSNFGFNVPWWDFLFGTYRAQPALGHEAMTIGITQFRRPREQWLDRMLIQPVLDDAGSYPVGEREALGPPEWIDAAAVSALLKAGVAFTLVDVREPDEFDGPLGHIAEAVNIPVGAALADPNQLASAGDTLVVLTCRTDRRSASVAEALRRAGVANVKVLRGGMERWNALGLPVERKTSTVVVHANAVHSE